MAEVPAQPGRATAGSPHFICGSPAMTNPLAEVVTLLQPRAPLSKVVSARGPWRVRRSEPGQLFYCVILDGACRLAAAGLEPMSLQRTYCGEGQSPWPKSRHKSATAPRVRSASPLHATSDCRRRTTYGRTPSRCARSCRWCAGWEAATGRPEGTLGPIPISRVWTPSWATRSSHPPEARGAARWPRPRPPRRVRRAASSARGSSPREMRRSDRR